MDGFLTNTENFAFGAGRNGSVGAVEAEGGFYAVSICVFGSAAELDGQGVLTGVL